MDSSRFDALARNFAAAGPARASRRSLLKAGAIAGVASMTHHPARAVAAQEAAPAIDRPPGGPTPAQLAWDLQYDPERIFTFVRDQVRYDPYSGILRGAKGTLWGLAGSAADQATLLAALLSEALVETRYVVGALDDAAAAQLEEAARWDEATVREHATAVLAFTNPGGTPVSLPEPSREQRERAEEFAREGARAVEVARAQAVSTVESLHEVLEGAGVELPLLSSGLPSRERTQHLWVQYRSGAEWVDLDPAFAGTEPGTAMAATSEVLEALSDDLFHTVTLRAVAEVVSGGAVVEQELLRYSARAADLVGVPLTLLHLAPQSFRGIGVSIQGALEGTTQFVPTIVGPVDGEAGVALTFGTGEGDAFGSTAPMEGQAVAEWMEFEVSPVDQTVRRARRMVFDRVGSARRTAGTLEINALAPVELVDLGGGEIGYLPLAAVTQIAVGGEAVPGGYFVQNYAIVDPVSDMANSLYGQRYARQALALDAMPSAGARHYTAAPSVTSITLAPTAITADSAQGQVIFDLIHQGLAAVATGPATPVRHPGILGGVQDHTAERLVLEEAHRAGGLGGPAPVSVGRLFDSAMADGVPIMVLTPDGESGPRLDISDQARAGIAAALADGYTVVVPERAIDLGGGPVAGWWQVDPSTGEVFDRLETGHGAVVLISPMAEEANLEVTVVIRGGPAYRRLGLCVFLTAFGAVMLFAGSFGVGVGATTGNPAAATLGALFGGSGAAAGMVGASCGG